MLKLTKYEFRKNLVSIIIVLLILAASEGYFVVSCLLKNPTHAAISMMLLMFFAFIALIVVIVFGINAYDKELRSKSSYLIFMTPNSSASIIWSKILYTLIFGLVLLGILIGLSYIDINLMTIFNEEKVDYFEMLKYMLASFGIEIDSVIFGLISFIVEMTASVFFLIALSYFSITLASTLLQNKKFKGFVSFVLFIAIMVVATIISNHLPVIYAHPATTMQAVIKVLPSFLFELAVSLGCIFGSAALLDKKVSL